MSPDYEIIINGASVSKSIKETNRLIELSIVDKRNLEADQLTLRLTDHDQAFALPDTGGEIDVSIGFSQDGFADNRIVSNALNQIGLDKSNLIAAGIAPTPLIEIGLWPKGKFIVDSIEYSGLPSELTIRASSADFRENLKSPHSQSYDQVSFIDVANSIAERNNLRPSISNTIAAKHIEHVDQTNESDANFIARLAKQYGGIALFKNQHLTIIDRVQPLSAQGKKLDDIDVDISQVESFTYESSDRTGRFTGARAFWIDSATGNRIPEIFGELGYLQTIRNTFSNQIEARHAAESAFKEIKTAQQTLVLRMATGQPRSLPSSTVNLTRFHPDLVNKTWLSTQITHNISDTGYTGTIECEAIDG